MPMPSRLLSATYSLTRALTGLAIDVLIIDPFVDSHSVSENDNTRIEGVVSTWRGIAEDAACCVNLVHHSRKAKAVSYTHLRAHETGRNLVCRLLLEKK